MSSTNKRLEGQPSEAELQQLVEALRSCALELRASSQQESREITAGCAALEWVARRLEDRQPLARGVTEPRDARGQLATELLELMRLTTEGSRPQSPGPSAGILAHVKVNPVYTDDESLQDGIDRHRRFAELLSEMPNVGEENDFARK